MSETRILGRARTQAARGVDHVGKHMVFSLVSLAVLPFGACAGVITMFRIADRARVCCSRHVRCQLQLRAQVDKALLLEPLTGIAEILRHPLRATGSRTLPVPFTESSPARQFRSSRWLPSLASWVGGDLLCNMGLQYLRSAANRTDALLQFKCSEFLELAKAWSNR